jgi:hypothetical protein
MSVFYFDIVLRKVTDKASYGEQFVRKILSCEISENMLKLEQGMMLKLEGCLWKQWRSL